MFDIGLLDAFFTVVLWLLAWIGLGLIVALAFKDVTK